MTVPLRSVKLRVTDLQRVTEFYVHAIGLDPLRPPGEDSVALGAPGGAHPILELVEAREAPPRPPGTTGLFHLAILVPNRAELARALARLVAAGTQLTGASDHLVSEALYLNDPEGNGIEIYRDRPSAEWGRTESGEIEMATLPLDARSLLAEADRDDVERPLAAETRLGHVHLNVADLEASERFYVAQLGFEVTVRSYPGALFLAKDGYHHHFGLNMWNGAGAPPPPEGARGLVEVELQAAVAGSQAGPNESGESILTDPSGIRLRVAPL